ncbi:NAD(P)-dependent oxidoreductase [Tolumonas osonensis]|uniref:Glyoxylate/hydroxypyruvate reductase B n=1 Tax=Tolumonas osonensis TaxID=675874 RepID=A0A841GJ75_9GAMM|nr:NAD(P)-dependent oxidoreductase [Tolumonas osonensis]MBB6054900.1 gluconate 2-dehydrogenase [Tolumonas osonensis]
MKPNVVLYRKIPDDLLAKLQEQCQVTFFDGINADNRAAFIKALAEAEGVIGVGVKFTDEVLAAAPKLRAASTISVGYDDFDVAKLSARSIALMHTPGVLTETTADTIFTLVLCAARRITELADKVKNGEWQGSIGPDWYGSNVHGKTIGILGMGRIGYAVAKRAHFGFDMNVIYYNRSAKPEAEQQLNARRCSLDEVLAEADFVCNVLPLMPETRHIINRETLAKMKPSAFFINGGRGASVDEAALVDALKSGVIKGAGLDVFETEPLPVSSELLSLPNVVALPHIGSATHETRYEMSKMAVENLLAALNGDRSKNCVNP